MITSPLTVLLIATRDPRRRPNGRIVVLRAAIDALVALGHRVHVLILGGDGGEATQSAAAGTGAPVYHWLPTPGLGRVLLNVATHALPGRLSMNECLFDGPHQRNAARDLARAVGADVVVADTIRAWEPALATGLPVVLDLDDLFSDRYRRMVDSRRDGDLPVPVLGYYGAGLPGWLRQPAEAAAGRLLAVESRLMARREAVAAGAAAAVAVVGSHEAAELARRTGRAVGVTGVAVEVMAPRPGGATPLGAAPAFVGGLDYQPNLDGLRWWRRFVIPALARAGAPDLVLHVFGTCPDDAREELQGDWVVLHGFVDDLASRLAGFSVFAAPLRDGGGLKVKVVEAMAAGLAVVATPAAVEALPVVDGEHCVVAADPDEFAAALVALIADPARAATLGRAGQTLARERFSPDALQGRWGALLDAATGGG